MFGGGIQPADHFVAVIFAVPAAGIVSAVLCLAKVLRLRAGLERRFPFTFKFSKMGFQWAQSALWWNKL
jgi:hypothetical protein